MTLAWQILAALAAGGTPSSANSLLTALMFVTSAMRFMNRKAATPVASMRAETVKYIVCGESSPIAPAIAAPMGRPKLATAM